VRQPAIGDYRITRHKSPSATYLRPTFFSMSALLVWLDAKSVIYGIATHLLARN
jgi:hypothetical protein